MRVKKKAKIMNKGPQSENSNKKKKNEAFQRWSKEFEGDGFVPVIHYFLDNYSQLKPYPLTHNEAMFVIHLIRYKWDEKEPYPAYKTIAKQMGISDKSARRYAKSLEEKNFLGRTIRKNDTNKFNLEPLIKALENDKKRNLKKKS